eukprot:CAMPEP_0201985726 /NCGR_PEP_ID=MMETSP0904-20121228/88024_1 /ASSEMBLY_ACC=CAM_ASM_000553 /TAXON_ID=420261 /ORGANISM="Thalassiosira antarctica, Strain CCMP982" /LENGTH=338 /DNA_ID=CAMNT_0048539493 /DNA_START=4 /DNA_END=1020 /DNA_ORIENTATION=+
MTAPGFLLLLVGICHWTSAFQNVATRLHSPPVHVGRPAVLKSSQSDTHDDQKTAKEIKDLMSKHDPILLFASKLLPAATAKDASALYAWCRRLDEITDDPNADLATIQQRLTDWEYRFDALFNGRPVDRMDAALAQCLQRNEGSLNEQPFQDMIAGMKSDAVDHRTVANIEELELYAYQVAGVVGLMLLPLLGADMDRARTPAIALGKAIQLINILRDATPDAELGRVYLPQDMLTSESVSNEDILNLKSSDGYCRVVTKVADRACELLMEAEVGKSSLPGLGPLFVQIIVELYRGYLIKLQQMNYDNLNAEGERVKISTLQKIAASCKAVFAISFPS